MIKYKKEAWLGNSIAAFALILNVLLIKTAFTDNADLYWLLIASIPLLSIGIYISWQTNRLWYKYYSDSRQSDTVKLDSKWLPQFGYANPTEEIDLSILIGNNQCRQPYMAPIFNIGSRMDAQNEKSFFHLLNEKKTGNTKNPKQDLLCTYSIEDGFVWQIRSDYSGCCCNNGYFNNEMFKKNVGLQEIKMIELVLSSSNKFKFRLESIFNIDETLVTNKNCTVFQKAGFSTFTDAEGMVYFLDSLRKLSEGKPIGIRLCINDKKEFYQICYAIQKTQFVPDFIVVEGSVTKQHVVNLKQKASTPIPLYEALQFVSATLRMYSLENEIKVIAAGEIVCGFDILKILALGANAVYSEMDKSDTINNSSKEYQFGKDQDIPKKHFQDIIKIMQTAGFRKISDITLPNLFRSMENFQGFTEPVRHQGSVRKINVSKLNTSIIKNERKKEHIS